MLAAAPEVVGAGIGQQKPGDTTPSAGSEEASQIIIKPAVPVTAVAPVNKCCPVTIKLVEAVFVWADKAVGEFEDWLRV